MLGFPVGIPTRFGYDAVATSKRRRAPISDVKSEDDQLNATQRRKLISTTRDLRRNYALTAWAIRKHLDYVASFSFQSKNGDKDLDNHIEKLVKWWSLPRNFDVAGRHGLHRFVRLCEASRVIDGDVFLYLLEKGYVQAIEGDRIANPLGASLPSQYKMGDFKRGIKCSKGGRPEAYIINDRSTTGSRLIYNRVIPAKYIFHFAYWDRFDQIRGISPLAAALNSFRDSNEGIGYALARAKVSQLFAFLLRREGAKAPGEVDAGEDGDDSDVTIDFGKGPIILNLDPEDTAEFLESKQPAQEFQAFMETIFSLSLKSLDIPYSFYNESFTNYSGARQALLLYEQSAKEKRVDVKALLDYLTNWRLMLWIVDGVLELPKGMTVSDLHWEWQGSGLPWIDPLKEVKADNEAIAGQFTSRHRIAKRMGWDWMEVLDELESEEKEIERRKLTKVSSVKQPDIINYSN
jgi:capsid protein